jgi:glucose/mannose-6-phosphate isomerase
LWDFYLMLDKPQHITEVDTDNVAGVLRNQPGQLRYAFEVSPDLDPSSISHILVAGMGGSALAAQLAGNWWRHRLRLPMTLVRDYDLPAFVDESTLVICSSYSGNTEETLSIYHQAGERGAPRLVLASGGVLLDRAREDGVPVYALPPGYQPRMAVFYGLRALAELTESLELLEGMVEELETAAGFLQQTQEDWLPEISTAGNRPKQIAEECLGKTAWVYAGPALSSAAYAWKIDINENAKHLATHNVLPEFTHNEFIGWSQQPPQKPFTVIQLHSDHDRDRIAQRFRVSNRLLSGQMPAPVSVRARGASHLQQLLYTCLLGDWTSFYLAVLNNVVPGRVEAIERLKRELAGNDPDSG